MRQNSSARAYVKLDLRSASILKDGRVMFNLAANKYRIVVWINYPYRSFTSVSSERTKNILCRQMLLSRSNPRSRDYNAVVQGSKCRVTD